MPAKKKVPQIEAPQRVEWAPRIEVKEQPADLRTVLEKVKAKEGVIGYILRAATSASVDIKDPSKIIDYAVLSASALESAESLLEAFGLGGISNVLVEANELKMLLLTVGEQRVSVFMEKNVDHDVIHKELVGR